MQRLFREDPEEPHQFPDKPQRSIWTTRVLGFLGSAVVCWLGLRFAAPLAANAWSIPWIDRFEIKLAITVVVSLMMAAVLDRIEGTIWGKYYVIVGYLLSLGLIVWVVLRLLHFV